MSVEPQKKKSRFRKCLSKIWNSFFNNDLKKIKECIKTDNLDKLIHFHKEKNFDFSRYDENGDSPFLMAARYGKINLIKYMLVYIPDLIKEDKSAFGDTALMIATFNNNFELVQYLVDSGSLNINCRDNQGYTPFIAACANGYLKLAVYFLCVKRADWKITGYNKQTALHRAAFYGEIKVIRLLFKYTKLSLVGLDKRGNTPFHMAAMNCHFQAIRVMLHLVGNIEEKRLNTQEELADLGTKEDKEYRKSLKKIAKKVLRKKNKFGETPLEILKVNLEKVKKMKNPNSEVHLDSVFDYVLDKNKKPFSLEVSGRRGRRGFTVFNLHPEKTAPKSKDDLDE